MPDEDLAGELRDALSELRAQLEWQRANGAAWLPRGGRGDRAATAQPPLAQAKQAEAPVPQRATASAKEPEMLEQVSPASHETLDALRAEIGDCTRCKLHKGRTNLVFGVGNPHADLMFVGEGPGHDEDLQAEPFVGRAGQLLTEIITKGMKLQRSDVYIANVVKCRPPNNRNPEGDEIASCMPFLHRQIASIEPKVIVALGTFAAQTLLAIKTPITRMRGNWHDYRGIKVMPTFHPAYLLRTPGDKRLVWNDIKLVMAELGLPV
jgi:uracil-DNA glycosylase family 4